MRTRPSARTSSPVTTASAARTSSSSTGTDEHGEPVVKVAEAEGVTPKEFADRNAQRFLELLPRIDASNDFFIRTSDPRHKARVQEVMQRIHDNGHTYKGVYEGWYCPKCADFKTENEIAEGNTCPIHLIRLTRRTGGNGFFAPPRFGSRPRTFKAKRPTFFPRRPGTNEGSGLFNGGRRTVWLGRARTPWGVRGPWTGATVF